MQTGQLISALVADRRTLPKPRRRVAIAVLVGGCIALAALSVINGMPLQEIDTTGVAAFAMKLGYTVAIAVAALAAALAAGRPGDKPMARAAFIALPLLTVAVATLVEAASAPTVAMVGLVPRGAHAGCIASVALSSLPVFAGLTWAFRPLAPTNPPLAGFLVGLSAGAVAAVTYAFFCPQTSVTFLLTGYTAAMLLPALVGGMIGGRLLRW